MTTVTPEELAEQIAAAIPVDPDDGTTVVGAGKDSAPSWGSPKAVAARVMAVVGPILGTQQAELEQWRAIYGETALRDATAILEERAQLRAELERIKAESTDPGLLRWCSWPGCWRSYNAVTGPVGLGTWRRHMSTTVLLCPKCDSAGHQPEFSSTYVACCSCGAMAPSPAETLGAAQKWWEEHASAAEGIAP